MEFLLPVISIVLALASLIVGGVALGLSCFLYSRVIGIEKSTHQVQFVPLKEEGGKEITGDILDEKMKEAFSEESFEKEYI